MLLLGRERRKDVAERARLDAHDFGVRVIAAHLVLGANDLSCRTVQVDELLELARRIDNMHEARGFDVPAVLVDDGAGGIELARGRCRASEPRGGILGEGIGRSRERDQREYGDDASDHAPTLHRTSSAPAAADYCGASVLCTEIVRSVGPRPCSGVVGEYSWCASR